jgi:hypothetical protein
MWCSFKQLYLFFSARLLYRFRVLSAPIFRSTIQTADVIIGTVYAVIIKVSYKLAYARLSAVLIVLLMMGAESTRNM